MESKTVAQNRKARFNYAIEQEYEAGIMLTGTEVKSLRQGRANIEEAYAGGQGGELWLFNANIPIFEQGHKRNHEPRRARKLLMHAREINKLIGATQQKGYAVVPLSLYFNKRGIAKVKLGLGKGKKEYEKRDTIKEREWGRQQRSMLKNKG